jgi:prepilin-type N-terminal cleavage/methylation domain-containing protein
MGSRDSRGRRKYTSERGFTLVEVSTVVLILGILIFVATASYVNVSRGMSLKGSLTQVEEALNRAKTAARQENVLYRLVFYLDTSSHPNTYEFYHNEYIGGNWVLTPVDKSVSGESVTEAEGHYYIRLANGVKIVGEAAEGESQVTVEFDPEGTIMTVTPATIVLQIGGEQGTITVDSEGMIEVQ